MSNIQYSITVLASKIPDDGRLWPKHVVKRKSERINSCTMTEMRYRIVEYLHHARNVEPQKPRNTHGTIELRLFIARC
jgi:hypothetical protein